MPRQPRDQTGNSPFWASPSKRRPCFRDALFPALAAVAPHAGGPSAEGLGMEFALMHGFTSSTAQPAMLYRTRHGQTQGRSAPPPPDSRGDGATQLSPHCPRRSPARRHWRCSAPSFRTFSFQRAANQGLLSNHSSFLNCFPTSAPWECSVPAPHFPVPLQPRRMTGDLGAPWTFLRRIKQVI